MSRLEDSGRSCERSEKGGTRCKKWILRRVRHRRAVIGGIRVCLNSGAGLDNMRVVLFLYHMPLPRWRILSIFTDALVDKIIFESSRVSDELVGFPGSFEKRIAKP